MAAGIVCGYAQQAPAAARVTGTVTAVKAAEKQVLITSDKGGNITLNTTDRSFVLRMPPGETDAKKAQKIALTELSAGDRLVASGQMSADQKTLDARTIMIMTKSDIAQIHQKEQEDWQKRGTTGLVSSVDAAGKTITIKAGQREFTVHLEPKTEMLRYALESAKLADAKPGKIADIKVGDEMHVLGNKNAEGNAITAEKIVSGSFKQIAATIESVDAAAETVQVKDLATKKVSLIKITPDSTMRKLPAMMAGMLAQRYAPGAGRGRGGAADDAGAGSGAGSGRGRGDGSGMMRPAGAGGPGGPGGAGGPGGRGGRGGDIKSMLDNLPAVPLTELKKGDAVMITTTEGTDASHATAVMLLAGVEPLLTASPTATRDIMSGWNLGGGGGGEGN